MNAGQRLPHLEESTTTWSISPFRIRFLDIVCQIDLSAYSLIVYNTGTSKFLLGPTVLINNSCDRCENITLRSDNKTLLSEITDFRTNFFLKKRVRKGEQILFEYSQDVEDIVKNDDNFKFNCIKCGK